MPTPWRKLMDFDGLFTLLKTVTKRKGQGAVHDTADSPSRVKVAEEPIITIHLPDLPAEVLSEIFIHCIPTDITQLAYRTWIGIPWVCSLWRSVALGCPEFWTYICPHGTQIWRDLLLARSKSVPITVRSSTYPDYVRIRNILLNDAARIGILDYYGPSLETDTHLNDLMGRETTMLKELRLRDNNKDTSHDRAGTWLPVFWGRKRPPRLTRLYLDACAFPWNSAIYTGLTHLHLRNIPTIQRSSSSGLFPMLVASPTLVELALTCSIPLLDDSLDNLQVTLAHLKSLSLNDSTSRCIDLLNALILPALFDLSVNSCDCWYTDDKSFYERRTLITSIRRHLIVDDACHDDYTILRMQSLPKEILEVAFIGRKHLRLSAKYPQPERTEDMKLVLDTLLVHSSCEYYSEIGNYITVLHVQDNVWVAPNDGWSYVGRVLRAVTELHIHNHFPDNFLEACVDNAMFLLGLTPYPVHLSQIEMAHTVNDTLFPALCSIHLWSLDCKTKVNALPEAPSVTDCLQAFLWARRQLNMRVTKLHITACTNVYSLDLARLGFFVDIKWDGNGRAKEDDKPDGGNTMEGCALDVFERMRPALSYNEIY